MNDRRVATAAAAGAMALGFAACTGGSKPADTLPITTPTTSGTTGTSASTTGSTPASSTTAPPSTSSAPSTTSTPGVPPPVANIPPAARPNTKAGAQEFVKYYMKQVVTSWSTANPELVDGLWDPECEWCSGMHETAVEFKQSGDRYVGSPFELNSIMFLEQAQGFTVFLVVGDTPKGKVVKANGSVRRIIDPEPVTLEVTCWFKGHWQATRVNSVGR